jgi:hypothetical protein
MTDRRRRVAYVGEEFDHVGRLSALFSVHWESLDSNDDGDGPESVSVEEAIAWGREHAAYVFVTLGDSDHGYTAGERDLNELEGTDEVDNEPLLPWPTGMSLRPRPFTGSEVEVTEGWASVFKRDDES